jgi:hypothetical protein
MRTRLAVSLITVLLAATFGLTGCGDDGAGPGNSSPVISSLVASADTVDPTALVTITCTAADGDGDPLSFAWDAATGEISGSGATVQWTAPTQAGFHWIRLEIADGNGGVAADSLRIAVNGGFFLAQTHSGLTKVTLEGTKSLFFDTSGQAEVLGQRIFVGPGGNIVELDSEGNVVATVTRPPGIPWATTFVVLPDAGFAFVQNDNDSIYFMGPNGSLVAAGSVVSPTPSGLQNTAGVVVGNTLLMGDTDAYAVCAYDLATHEGWVFRDFVPQDLRPTDIDYYDGTFYFSGIDVKIHRFIDGGDVETVSTLPHAH